MAIVGATQAIAAAFIFGIVVNAATAALFLYINGHGTAIFRDGLRLVLITFLVSSALWALIDFITTLIDIQDSSSPCQIGVTFATIFDQLGRFSIEQYMLWAMNSRATKMSAGQLIPQLLIWGRFIAGAVFVGFTKPQVDTFCVAMSSLLPISIVVIVLDAVIILLLVARVFSTNMIADIQQGKVDAGRSKGVVLVMLGFTIWTATSIPLLLGMSSMDLALRTALPAGGMSILILIVTAGFSTLATPRGTPSMPPEAPSPRHINISRDMYTSDSDYPPTHYEDLKEAAIRSSTTFINPRDVPTRTSTTFANPREAPSLNMAKVDEAGLPAIARPITGVAGIGGVAVQGALFPPVRDNPANEPPKRADSKQQKKSFFSSGKGPASDISVGKLKIGNPILQDNEAQNPLNKIATMDLQEAARQEKERRAKTQRESALIASRPAPQPPSMSSEAALKRSVSTKRKEVQSIASEPSAATMPAANLMPQRSDSTSSGAQLSPGVEKLRQRSPRQSQEAMAPQDVSARPPIRPSRQIPDSPKSPPPEPTKTPLQRRPTTGLPSNPRAQGIKLATDPVAQRQQTVLFVNNIIYDDPKIVQTILDGATQQPFKSSPPEAPLTSGSIVHRPRPIPRKSAEAQHQRTKSGGSIVSRKSILMSNPGSPTALPPLPPAPKSAGNPGRPQPNDTRSMTFDEKMTLFFPAPPSGKSIGPHDSIPAVPPLPAPFLDDSSDGMSDHRRSNRTTKTSIQTEHILAVDEIQQGEELSHFSPAAYQNIADELGDSWMPGLEEDEARNSGRQGYGGGKRGSSPVIPIRGSAWTETSVGDDGTTNWGSVHSPQIALAATRQVVKTADIKKNERPQALTVSPGKKVPSMVEGRGSEVMTVMLDADVESDDASMADTQRGSGSWHRRVGDDCPSFSDRKEKVRSRKGPPPTPLLLKTKPSSKNVVVQAPEPSPMESPEHALKMIQEQLKKFEQPNRASVESQGARAALLENLEKEMGDQESHWQEMKYDLGRDSMSSVQTTSPSRNSRGESMTGIIPISRESSIRSNISIERRASRLAKLRNSGATKSNEDPSRAAANNNSVGSSTGNSWQARLAEAQMEYMDNATELLKKRSMNFLSINKDVGSPTPPDSDYSDEEIVQPRVNIATVVPQHQQTRASLWEPSASAKPKHDSLMWQRAPPEATAQPDAELPSLSVRPAQRKEFDPLRVESTELWRKPHSGDHGSARGLWRPRWAAAAPPAAPIRSAQTTSKTPPQVAPTAAPRPVTQRPPRRNKRVTMLPDIVEDPVPLPDKRGTLGIFQFPWGEKSDLASIQARPTVYMAMPGTMTSGGPINDNLEARSRQLEQAEYSSSFFDDYDDEDRSSDYEDDEDSEDDGFDESTLWDIASLLKSDSVPSKNSLLPPPLASSVVDDYMDEGPSDNEDESSRQQSIMIGLAEEQQDVLFEKPTSNRDSQLWAAEPKNKRPARIGLPHPSDKTWARYSGITETARAKPRKAEVAAIKSDNLWVPEQHAEGFNDAPMWTAQQEKSSLIPRRAPAPESVAAPVPKPSAIPRAPNEDDIKEARKTRKQVTMGLWDVPAEPESVEDNGLFVAGAQRSDIRTTAKEPAAKVMERKPRQSEMYKPLDRIQSVSMWDKSTSRKVIMGEMSNGMWNALGSSKSGEGEADGMFKVDRSRAVFRTTSKEPAAKNMDRKSRVAQPMPVPALESTALWAARVDGPSEHDWMTRNAVQAKSEPKLPLRRQYRRPEAYRADWEAALNEAIAASYPSSTRLARKTSTPADWEAALNDAVIASYPGSASLARKASTPADWEAALDEALTLSGLKKVGLNVATRHPVFFTSSLQTRSEWFHPAATGYTYDVAIVNPVFFGSLAITCAEQSVHPAMQQYASRKLRRAAKRAASAHSRSDSSSSESSRSRSVSRDRDMDSDSRRRKDEIRAQIRALEVDDISAAEVVAVSPVLAMPESYDQAYVPAAIQAQIEALEQEKLFVAEAAKADYERRTSMAMQLETLDQEQGGLVQKVEGQEYSYQPEPAQQYYQQEQQYYQTEQQYYQQEQQYYQQEYSYQPEPAQQYYLPEQQYYQTEQQYFQQEPQQEVYYQPEPQQPEPQQPEPPQPEPQQPESQQPEPQQPEPQQPEPQQPEEEPVSIMELQRQMEAAARARVSTVWYDPISAQTYVVDPEPEPQPQPQMFTDAAVAYEEPESIGMALESPEPELVQAIEVPEASEPAETTAITTPPQSMQSTEQDPTLWMASSSSQEAVSTSAPMWAPGAASPQAENLPAEDAEAEARRARNRKMQQAVGVEQPVSGSMWTAANENEGEKDWLSTSAVNPTSGVHLRF